MAGFSANKWTGLVLGLILFVISFLTSNRLIPGSYTLLVVPLLLIAFIAELFQAKETCLKNIAILSIHFQI